VYHHHLPPVIAEKVPRVVNAPTPMALQMLEGSSFVGGGRLLHIVLSVTFRNLMEDQINCFIISNS
jgi:hypothetical protein